MLPAEGARPLSSLSWAAEIPPEVTADAVMMMAAFSALFLIVRLVLVVCCRKIERVVAPPHPAVAAEIAALRRQLDAVSARVNLCLARLERQAKKGANFYVKPAGTKIHLARECPRIQVGEDNVETHWASVEFAEWLLRAGVCCTHCAPERALSSGDSNA